MKIRARENIKREEMCTTRKMHSSEIRVPENSANNLLFAIALTIALVSQWLFLLITDLLKPGEIERPSNGES